MIYADDKLRIVPFERSQHMTEEYRSWFHDQQTCKFNAHGLFPYSPAAMEAFVKTIEQGSDSKIVWAIEASIGELEYTLTTPEGIAHEKIPKGWLHIGNCALDRINWINRSAEITIVLGKERGHGHGEQACRWMLEHAFFRLGLNRVWTGTAAVNAGMNAVCKKLDMQHEGTLVEAMLLHGEYVDINMYAVTRHQWDQHNYSAEVK